MRDPLSIQRGMAPEGAIPKVVLHSTQIYMLVEPHPQGCSIKIQAVHEAAVCGAEKGNVTIRPGQVHRR